MTKKIPVVLNPSPGSWSRVTAVVAASSSVPANHPMVFATLVSQVEKGNKVRVESAFDVSLPASHEGETFVMGFNALVAHTVEKDGMETVHRSDTLMLGPGGETKSAMVAGMDTKASGTKATLYLEIVGTGVVVSDEKVVSPFQHMNSFVLLADNATVASGVIAILIVAKNRTKEVIVAAGVSAKGVAL